MKRILILVALLLPIPALAQLTDGDFLVRGTAGVTNTEVAAGANIDTSKLNSTVLVEGDLSSSAQLAGLISDEVGTGLLVLQTAGTHIDPVINDLLTFTATAGDDTCGPADFWIKGNDTSKLLRGCEDGNLFTLSAVGTNPLSLSSCEALTLDSGGNVTLTGAANTWTCHTIDTFASAASDDWSGVTCTAGSMHTVKAFNDARTVVITLGSGQDFSMDALVDRAQMDCDVVDTLEIANNRSNG